MDNSETMEKILAAIKDDRSITIRELSAITSLSKKGMEWQIAKLKSEGKLKRVGPARGEYWKIIEDKENKIL